MKLIDYLHKDDPRKFIVCFHSGTEILTDEFDLQKNIDESSCEHMIAIMEIVDKIDKLKYGESIPFYPDRGNHNEHGFVLRVK